MSAQLPKDLLIVIITDQSWMMTSNIGIDIGKIPNIDEDRIRIGSMSKKWYRPTLNPQYVVYAGALCLEITYNKLAIYSMMPTLE